MHRTGSDETPLMTADRARRGAPANDMRGNVGSNAPNKALSQAERDAPLRTKKSRVEKWEWHHPRQSIQQGCDIGIRNCEASRIDRFGKQRMLEPPPKPRSQIKRVEPQHRRTR
jgi:hypothetical protein